MNQLEKHQKIILTGFTGIMCCNNFRDFHEDVERRLGRPVFTHEFPSLQEDIKQLYKEDFLKIVGE